MKKKLVHSSGIYKTRYRKGTYYLIIIISYELLVWKKNKKLL